MVLATPSVNRYGGARKRIVAFLKLLGSPSLHPMLPHRLLPVVGLSDLIRKLAVFTAGLFRAETACSLPWLLG